MKKFKAVSLIFALMLTLCTACSFAAGEIEADSRISAVMIYPGAALITRQAELKLNPGEYTVTFSNIIPEVDENSLRVSAEGNAEVKVRGASLKREYVKEAPVEKIKQLEKEIRQLEDQAKIQLDLKNILIEEKSFLDSIRLFSRDQLPKELITKMPAVKDLDDTLKFLDLKLKDNFAAVMDAELKIRDLKERIDVLKRELSEISGPAEKIKRSIIVELEIVKSGAINLKASYLVGGASWQPIYDARASFLKSEVELISHGIVRQKTGEDWDNVEMSLSTAKPAVGGNMPYVSPWLLRPYQPRDIDYETRGSGLSARKMKMASHQYAAFDTDNAFKEEMSMPAAEAPLYSQAEEKGIAVVYTLPRKVSVKSDGSENKLPVSSQILKADFEYSSYPRLVLSAYLGSRVINAKDLQLLAGRVNIFLEGDYVGTSNINNIGPQEEFDLYLGADENVKIKREMLEKKVDETIIGNLPSSVKKTNFKYKLTVENYKTKKTKMKLFEAIPVPEDDRIKIKIGQVSLEPKVKDWKDRKGIWLWELELEPKGKKEIIYSYTVEHPRDMQIEGL